MRPEWLTSLIEKIYDERSTITNISVFISAFISIIIYILINDSFIASASAIGLFSISKVFWTYLLGRFNSKKTINEFSTEEKVLINEFINRGSVFITNKDMESIFNDKGGDALHSLDARGIVRFIDRSFGDGPSGFSLDENIYKLFLKGKKTE